jgi:hypothetical protein
MQAELSNWNDGVGIDLDSWVGCMGSFSLAVDYAAVFCPDFTLFEDYILRGGLLSDQAIQVLRGFAARPGSTSQPVEAVMTHLHPDSLQYLGCEDISADKLVFLGERHKAIHEARLALLFPDRPCTVDFHVPENAADLDEYQLTFWQKKHELRG